ncbi:GH116 family glycosyl-hydrolase [Zobellia alginiliquefaciens]|uniref:GH116 family glycosyl-hydrolase n=1 Tax=Zobellia alginiliquefaciens TaxID=3032586 RepID=UPI0023E39A1D|nr:GH116 family glycosyl-hydrolase [Zobellia alginiliquefaciens]
MKHKILVLGVLFCCALCVRSQSTITKDQLELNSDKTPVVKNFPENFEAQLVERGEPLIYTKENSNNFEFIGMPIGGIGAGQLYLGGDGKLWFWDIFNTNYKKGQLKGEEAYEHPYKRSEEGEYGTHEVEQGFAVKVKRNGAKAIIKKLDRDHISDIQFKGQYPIGEVKYADNELPVTLSLEAFSPYLPLDVESSSFPATIFNFTITNESDHDLDVELGGWLENAVFIETRGSHTIELQNKIAKSSDKTLRLNCSSVIENESDTLVNKYDYGSMGLTLLEGGANSYAVSAIDVTRLDESLFVENGKLSASSKNNQKPLVGALIKKLTLKPEESKKVSFVLTWYFPNSQVAQIIDKKGKSYNNAFNDADEVATGIVSDFKRLSAKTKLWRDTWYDSTLPYWFLDRTFLNTSILASSTSHIFENGQFYGFEGGYQGLGTCTHVWSYVQAMGRLFPELEISLREHTDFSSFPDGGLFPSGVVNFRGRTKMGEGWGNGMAVDGQSGLVQRSLLTHQSSVDNQFLKNNYDGIKTVMNGLINANDDNHDGILSGPQHNTLDADWYGEITWLSLQYQSALRAMAVMAQEMKDEAYAQFCISLADKGKHFIENNLFNGEYFIQKGDPEHPHSPGVYNGCEYSQLYGQSWAYQLGLGQIIDSSKVTEALNSLWKFNFTTDVGPYREIKPAGRWYAMTGEGGFVACTWPNGGSEVLEKGNPRFAAYNNESQNGYEYALSHLMMSHEMPLRSLAHTWYMHNNRYHGSKRNPWCEVEWGIHYSRSMASYGVFIAATGFEYHGPKGYIGFAPKITPTDFKAPFTTAQGWGTFEQKIAKKEQQVQIGIKHGQVKLKMLAFEVPVNFGVAQAVLNVNGRELKNFEFNQSLDKVVVTLQDDILLEENQSLQIHFKNAN